MEKEAVEYEKTLGKTLSLPATAICAYDYNLVTKAGKLELPLELIRAHGAVLFALPEAGMVRSF
jgi:hypothetical protein